MRTLGPPFAAEESAQVIANARAMLGWEWKHQGRTSKGIDCLGLIALAVGAVRPVQDRRGYGRTPYNHALRASLVEQLGSPVDDWRPADIVTMRWTGEERHVAIITDHPEGLGLIHCYSFAPGGQSGGQSSGRVVEHRLSPEWQKLIVEAFRP